MKLHILVDFMHIYYKYYYQLKAGKLKRLSSAIEWNGSVIEKDTTMIYYPLKDIEGIRKNLEMLGHDVTMSICFDTKADKRLEENTEYKANRKKTLTDDDFKNIDFIADLLRKAGHNTYRIAGYEADDLINHLCKTFRDDFDYSIIYTNDKDLLVNVDDKTGVMRFKQGKGYTQVDINNYESYLENEFGVYIPYNAIGLYLASVGDTADHIKGINKFGKVAFKKLITKLAQSYTIDWVTCGNYHKLEEVVDKCKDFLTDEQFKELKESFILVSNVDIGGDVLESPINKSTSELREKAYREYNMLSLIP